MNEELSEGWDSKKLHFGLLSVVLVFSGWLMSAHWPALGAQYMTMVGGITGVFALFCGANVANKMVVGTNIAKLASAQTASADISDEELEEED